MLEILNDWGTRLELCLYRNALRSEFCDPQTNAQTVAIRSGAQEIGRQPMDLVAKDSALAITAVPVPSTFKIHLRRRLRHTNFAAIAWLNLYRQRLELAILQNQG